MSCCHCFDETGAARRAVPGAGSYCGGRPCAADSAAMLASAVAPRNSLRSLRSLRSDNRGESDERSALRARRARAAALLAAPQVAAPPGTAHRAAALVLFVDEVPRWCRQSRGWVCVGSDIVRRRGAQGSWPRARSARFVHLTRRDCSSAANEVSEASFAAGHETEHRRGVGAKGDRRTTSAGAYPPAALPRASAGKSQKRRSR